MGQDHVMTSNVILSRSFSFVSMATAFLKRQRMCYTSPTTSVPVSPRTHTHTRTHTVRNRRCVFCFHTLPLPSSPFPPSPVDWVMVEVLCMKQGGCGGRTRYILKDAIRYLPLYGWVLGEVGDLPHGVCH